MAAKLLASAIISAALILTGCSTTETASQAANGLKGDPLMSVLTNSTGGGLGLTETQAAGGLGSVMSLASNKLPAADYAALGEALPNADKYIAAAQNAGVLTDPITDVDRLNSAMRKLGITRWTSVVTDMHRHASDAGRAILRAPRSAAHPSGEHAR